MTASKRRGLRREGTGLPGTETLDTLGEKGKGPKMTFEKGPKNDSLMGGTKDMKSETKGTGEERNEKL